jgi:hypothetical protein
MKLCKYGTAVRTNQKSHSQKIYKRAISISPEHKKAKNSKICGIQHISSM